ncbi:hypothetical protein Ddye_032064 [Dipteronia dyeriana]|uniref:Uncharacterized protein n=1 Tax=Dipteronia dyeriana TaxID=168575 RepID=A0AAD9TK58_9ROSI|nr:hypothetical protein Ddye_032064 [Dipteronia dyeriana]
MEPIPDAAGPCIGGSIQPGGQISSCFKPTEAGLEPILESSGPSQSGNKPTELWSEPSSDDWLQEHCAPFADLNMSSQAKPLQLNGWTITPYEEVRGKSNDF